MIGPLNWDNAVQGTKDVVSFAYLVTVLLFARSQLYADRAERPGFAASSPRCSRSRSSR